jgi:methylenetetrahydrofolate reductase (NADPH)
VAFRLGRFAHRRVFDPRSNGFRAGRALYSRLEASGNPLLKALHGIERSSKAFLYGCRDCGDCSIPEIGFLCPESQCAKNQRNGPCGGSRSGRCEVSDRHCIWVRAYYRSRVFGEERSLLARPPVIRDGLLQGTSAWANTFLGRDHATRSADGAAATRSSAATPTVRG